MKLCTRQLNSACGTSTIREHSEPLIMAVLLDQLVCIVISKFSTSCLLQLQIPLKTGKGIAEPMAYLA